MLISQKLYWFIILLRERLYRLRTIGWYKKLADKKRDQKEAFQRLKLDFSAKYRKIKSGKTNKKYVVDHWSHYNAAIEKKFLPYPPFSFLRDPVIMHTMFMTRGGNVLKNQLDYLKRKIDSKTLGFILEEDYVGEPLIMEKDFFTSHNVIHQLFHFLNFEEITSYKIKNVKTIVDWGAGYGNMAKIFRRLNKLGTYILIDIPIFSCLQWLYLSSIFGEEKVHFITSRQQKIRPHVFNVLPFTLLKDQSIKADLFISTWALSESLVAAQDYVVKKKWFGAKHILVAYQRNNSNFPYAERVGELARKTGATILEIKVLPGNYYAFR